MCLVTCKTTLYASKCTIKKEKNIFYYKILGLMYANTVRFQPQRWVMSGSMSSSARIHYFILSRPKTSNNVKVCSKITGAVVRFKTIPRRDVVESDNRKCIITRAFDINRSCRSAQVLITKRYHCVVISFVGKYILLGIHAINFEFHLN